MSTLSRYLNELDKYPPIPQEEELELILKAKAGDRRAFEKVINSNLRFVVKVAKTYENNGIELEDLIAEGNHGMVKAFERFDTDRGVKFISYAI